MSKYSYDVETHPDGDVHLLMHHKNSAHTVSYWALQERPRDRLDVWRTTLDMTQLYGDAENVAEEFRCIMDTILTWIIAKSVWHVTYVDIIGEYAHPSSHPRITVSADMRNGTWVIISGKQGEVMTTEAW